MTREERRVWLDTLTGVSLGSDAFFPFGDNIERAHKSGVSFIALFKNIAQMFCNHTSIYITVILHSSVRSTP